MRLLLLAVPACFAACAAVAQDIPGGVKYSRSSAVVNVTAQALLQDALGKSAYVDTKLPDSITCGPTLWNDLKGNPSAVLLSAKTVDAFLSVPEPIHVEMRGLITANQRQEFWRALWAAFPDLKGATVRRPSSSEISYYWATIPFDIQEPFFVLDTGPYQFVVNIPDEGKGPMMLWIDRVDNLHELKTAK